MTNSSEDWDENKCIKLIREYRSRPELWDQNHPLFFKKTKQTKKSAAWDEIGEALGVPAKQCKHKMLILMSSFRREKAKIIHRISSENGDDASDVYRSKWFGFKEMVFLMDKRAKRKRRHMDISKLTSCKGYSPEIKKMLLRHYSQQPSSTATRKIKRYLSYQLDKQDAENSNDASSEEVLDSPTPGHSQLTVERDEITTFANFIANKMRKYSEATKNTVQREICEVIFRADQLGVPIANNDYGKYTLLVTEPAQPIISPEISPGSPYIKIQPDSDYSD